MDKNEIYDLQTKEVMQRVLTPKSNCIDIGCHTGKILDEILKFAPKGSHYAFEPLPKLHECLLQKYSHYKNIKIFKVALSNSKGYHSFQYVTSNPGYSGLKKRRYDRPDETIETITVKVARLDDLLSSKTKIDFIKIDVEGAELQVFEGAKKIIKKSKPVIVFEHGLGSADYYNTKPEQVYDFLVDKCELKCFRIDEWLESYGKKALDRDSFCDDFRSGRNYYFLAAPNQNT